MEASPGTDSLSASFSQNFSVSLSSSVTDADAPTTFSSLHGVSPLGVDGLVSTFSSRDSSGLLSGKTLVSDSGVS